MKQNRLDTVAHSDASIIANRNVACIMNVLTLVYVIMYSVQANANQRSGRAGRTGPGYVLLTDGSSV